MIPTRDRKPPLLFIFISLLLIASACNAPNRQILSTEPPATASVFVPTPTFTFIQYATREPRCTFLPLTRLIVGERGRVTNNDKKLNLRSGPGTNYDVITQLEPNTVFVVLELPICGSDYVWYRVQVGDDEGFIAEGDFEEYYAEPYLTG